MEEYKKVTISFTKDQLEKLDGNRSTTTPLPKLKKS